LSLRGEALGAMVACISKSSAAPVTPEPKCSVPATAAPRADRDHTSMGIARFKDPVTMAGSAGGLLFGAAGFVLGLLGYLRSLRLDRKLFQEPYFKRIWPDIYKTVSDHINSVRFALDALEADERPTRGENPLGGYHVKRLHNNFPIDQYVWDYDKNIKKKIWTHYRLCYVLTKLISRHAALIFPSTSGFSVWVASVNWLAANPNPIDNAAYEMGADTRAQIKRATAIYNKYTPGNTSPSKLARSRRHQLDCWILQKRIHWKVKAIKKQIDKLKHALDFCNHRLTAQ
jgi:hypothetical protein